MTQVNKASLDLQEPLVVGRIARLEQLATEVFANQTKAARWMNEPNPALANRCPLDLVGTEEGFEAASDVLTRIESGTYS